MANQPPAYATLKAKGSSWLTACEAEGYRVKACSSSLLMGVPLLSGTLAVSVATVGAVRSTVHVKTDNSNPTFP